MIVSFEETQKLLYEDFDLERATGERDVSSVANYFTPKPKGVIIQDTWNNFAYPIQPKPRIDTKKFNTPTVFKIYRNNYTAFKTGLLPWHFVIEMVEDIYYCINTRPITLRYPITNREVIKRKKTLPFNIEWDDNTTKFFDEQVLEVSECIHVAILGDSTRDVYPKQFYKTMGSSAIRPILHYFKLPPTLNTRTFNLNTGRKFNVDYVMKFVNR